MPLQSLRQTKGRIDETFLKEQLFTGHEKHDKRREFWQEFIEY